jgi:glutamine synthetase type III
MSNAPLGVVKQGDSLQINFIVQHNNGAALDITGATARWTIATVTDKATPILTKTATITDAASGLCSVVIAKGELSAAGTFYHELEVILASGESYTVADGTMIVEPTIRPAT